MFQNHSDHLLKISNNSENIDKELKELRTPLNNKNNSELINNENSHIQSNNILTNNQETREEKI